jgi:hypothetical protein
MSRATGVGTRGTHKQTSQSERIPKGHLMTNNTLDRLCLRAPLMAMTVLPLFLLLCGTGCASGPADLRLTSVESNKIFCSEFSSAYLSKAADGNTEIVLVNDQSLRQVMHVKVLWLPQRGAKPAHPSFTNAAIHWYVFPEPASGAAPAVIEYTGAGYVALSGAQVTIRNATLKPVTATHESLKDPVGTTRLTGTFAARRSSHRVREVLAQVEIATANATAEQASAR